jgi:cell wall assembly regulator SMI1
VNVQTSLAIFGVEPEPPPLALDFEIAGEQFRVDLAAVIHDGAERARRPIVARYLASHLRAIANDLDAIAFHIDEEDREDLGL